MAFAQIPEPGEPVHLATFFLEDRHFPSVYFLYHRGEVVYVGQTRTLKFRIDRHIADGVKVFDAIGFIRCQLNDLLRFESHYIKALAPKYNACQASKRVRERASWATGKNREAARRPDAFTYHIEAAASCGMQGDDGDCYIRPRDFGKFLMVTDKDATDLIGEVDKPVPLMHMLLWAMNNRDLAKAQQRFEEL